MCSWDKHGGCLNTDLSIFQTVFFPHLALFDRYVWSLWSFCHQISPFSVTLYSLVDYASAVLETLLSVDFFNSKCFICVCGACVCVCVRVCVCLQQWSCDRLTPIYEVVAELSFHSLPLTLICETRWKFQAKFPFFSFWQYRSVWKSR